MGGEGGEYCGGTGQQTKVLNRRDTKGQGVASADADAIVELCKAPSVCTKEEALKHDTPAVSSPVITNWYSFDKDMTAG